MYTRLLGSNMAKLYWRIKKNGKWTWVPMKFQDGISHSDAVTEVLDYIALPVEESP